MACKQRALLLTTYVLVLKRRKLGRKLKVITRSLVKAIFTEERKQLAEWEKLVKEVKNAGREYSLRYLWMRLEWFKNLFSLAAQHCAKNVQIRSFFWSSFSPNMGKYGPEKKPYLGTFYTVLLIRKWDPKLRKLWLKTLIASHI